MPTQMSDRERRDVKRQLDELCREEFVVHTDDGLRDYIHGYRKSQGDAKNIFNSYMRNFLTLSKDLRTDQDGITTLLDNVPSVFTLTDDKD